MYLEDKNPRRFKEMQDMSSVTVFDISILFGMAVLLFVCFLFLIAPNSRIKGKAYDERQLLARNQAYKWSFVLLLAYSTVCAVLGMLEIEWAEPALMFLIGIYSSLTLFVTICILKDAYKSVTRSKRPYDFWIFTLLYGGFYLVKFLLNVFKKGESIFTDGKLNDNIVNLLFAVMFLSMFAAKMISSLMKKADDDE